MTGLGPFDLTPARIESLGPAFTEFVNRLLNAETSSSGILGYCLTTNLKENTPDGGVDAALSSTQETDWLPRGDSAWQFKRSGLGPKACADELADAMWAHEYLRSGGSYIVVLGAELTDRQIKERRLRVGEKAVELGLVATDDHRRIRVYDANQLARWASRYPALAISRLAGGPGLVAVDYQTWSNSRGHQTEWTPNTSREAAIATIRGRVGSSGIVELRVQGESGIGKTRLVMEALRDDSLQPLVAYVSEEDALCGELVAHLVSDARSAILVVDECPAERHIKLHDKLPNDPAIKLVTIGHAGLATTRTPVISVDGLAGDDCDKFLIASFPALSSEARRYVSDHSQGNVRWMQVLADRILRSDGSQAAELIQRNDIEQFITTLLPEGRAFFFCAVLALLERVGWDRDLRPQLEKLASFAHTSLDEMVAIGRELELSGLLTKQGRYRAITPRPLAVFLAAEAWRTESDRIINELLPSLDDELALALFSRVAELGRFEPARAVLAHLLSGSGPFGSRSAIGVDSRGKLLTQLAIVLPDEVTRHLEGLIGGASIEDLRAETAARRDLVWTLEKLAWHSRTFESAANSLLRLALGENESFGNNASGVWAALFGTVLPGTAASPNQRLAYLRTIASSEDVEHRRHAVGACNTALSVHESINVSAELQGGVLVEARGAPQTWEEWATYRRGAIEVLDQLTQDQDPQIADTASDTLLRSLYPFVGDPLVGEALADVLAKWTGDRLGQLRRRLEQDLILLRRVDAKGHRTRIEGLERLESRLPTATPVEQLAVWLQFQHWDLEDGELRSRVLETLKGVPNRTVRDFVHQMMGQREVAGAWELGYALARLDGPNDELELNLYSVYSLNPAALVGYLRGLVDDGHASAFDDFLDGERARDLDTLQRVSITVRGPCTPDAKSRVLVGLHDLPVAQGTYVLFGWRDNLNQNDVKLLLDDWLDRIASQADYSAVVDWLHLWLYPRKKVPRWLRGHAFRLLMLRRQHPDMGQQQWDWCQLASSFIPYKTSAICTLLLDLISDGSLLVFGEDQESALLAECATADPVGVWGDVSGRLLAGDWRISTDVRGWLLESLPAGIVIEWIGSDLGRARLVAKVASVGGDEPTAIGRFLLDAFGDDDNVASGLTMELISGGWSGNESDRLAAQIAQMNKWRTSAQEPMGVKRWAGRMIEYLEARRREALEREAERDW